MKPALLLAALLGLSCEGTILGSFTNGSAGGGRAMNAGGGQTIAAGGEAGGGDSGGGTAMSIGGGASGGGIVVYRGDGGIPTTAEVFERLKPTCEGCHRVTERPYFESLTKFQTLVVSDRKWITPGSPQTSGLLRLLEGAALPSMPPASSAGPFVNLERRGRTYITLVELESWVRSLAPDVVVTEDVPHLRRKAADQILEGLKFQLGLTDADLVEEQGDPAALRSTLPVKVPKNEGGYAFRSPHATPANSPDTSLSEFYVALGGSDPLQGVARNDAITSTFSLTFTHISQAWCRAAVTKPNNTVFFTRARATDTSAASALAIRANISDLSFKMLGERPAGSFVDELFSLFQAYEPKGTETAWTAVCAALVRNPLWMLY